MEPEQPHWLGELAARGAIIFKEEPDQPPSNPSPDLDTNALIEHNLDLVRSCALSRNLPWLFDELADEGAIGLVNAARQFDGRGNFRSFAAQRIKWSMLDYLRRIDLLTVYERQRGDVPERISVSEEAAVQLQSDAGQWERLENSIDDNKLTRRLLRKVAPRTRKMLRWRYYQDWTNARIGLKLGICKEQVSIIINGALLAVRLNERVQTR